MYSPDTQTYTHMHHIASGPTSANMCHTHLLQAAAVFAEVGTRLYQPCTCTMLQCTYVRGNEPKMDTKLRLCLHYKSPKASSTPTSHTLAQFIPTQQNRTGNACTRKEEIRIVIAPLKHGHNSDTVFTSLPSHVITQHVCVRGGGGIP